ncbi:MAG TPA: hypothetical protein VEC36_05945, partial [Patescibacteria group bacterium]|nr:hypothetical protein [Patescibacteria group bacterium]
MSAELDISYLPRSQSWVKLGLAGNPASGNKAKPSQPVVKAEGSDILAPWGDNNLYPQDIFNLARKNDLIPSTIDIQVALLVAAGYVIGQVEQVNGQDVFTPRSNSEISTFLDNTDIYGYLARAGSDFYWYRNGFPEIIRSDDGSKIIGVRGQQAMFCRYSQHNTSGIIEHCLINADWANEDKKYTIKLPVLSKFFPVDDLRSRKGTNFIYPLSFPSPGATHYALAPWHASVESKRLELANAFPVFKLALMNNQMTVKYLIEIADKYWPWRFTDWDTKPELKEARVDQVKQDLEDYLTGN